MGGHKTQWLGFWKTREGVYQSNVVLKKDLQQLPRGIRMYLRYNKGYEKGGNRPRFVLCFADKEFSEEFAEPLEWNEYKPQWDDKYVSLETAIAVAQDCIDDAAHGEYYEDAQSYARFRLEEAAKTVKEMMFEQ